MNRTENGYKFYETDLSVQAFGAYGDGVTDDTVSIQNALNEAAARGGGSVYFARGTYICTSEIVIPDGVYLRGAGQGATTLTFENAPVANFPNIACMRASGSLTAEPDLSANIVAGTTTATLNPTADFEDGDVFVVFDPTNGSFNPARNEETNGEFAYVLSQVGNVVTVDNPFFGDYTAAVVNIYKANMVSVGVSDMEIIGIGENNTIKVLEVNLGYKLTFNNLRMRGSGNAHLSIVRCFDVNISGIDIFEHQAVTGGLRYGIILANCQRATISGCEISTERHPITVGGGAYDAAIANREIVVDGCVLTSGQNSAGGFAFGGHGNMEFYTVSNCILVGGAVMAGDKGTLRGCTLFGAVAQAALVFSELIGVDFRIEGNRFEATRDVDNTSGLMVWDQTETPVGEGRRLTRTGGVLRIYDNTFDMKTFDGKAFLIRKRFTVSDVDVEFCGNTVMRASQDFTQTACLLSGYQVGVVSHWRRMIVRDNRFRFQCLQIADACPQILHVTGNEFEGGPAGPGFNYLGDSSLPWDDETIFVEDNIFQYNARAGCQILGSDNTITVIVCRNNVSLRNDADGAGSAAERTSIYITTAKQAVFRDNVVGDDVAVPNQTSAWYANDLALLEAEGNTVVGTITTVTKTAITKEIAHFQENGTRVVAYGTAPPAAGTWVQGDRVWNTAPAAGGTPGWVCTTGGTPGTWKAMSNLAP